MLEVPENQSAVCLNELLDELSTRLIIDGVDSLDPADFTRLSRTAADLGFPNAEKIAQRVAADIAQTAPDAIPELTRIISSGLVELRNQLHESSTVSSSTDTQSAHASATAASAENHDENGSSAPRSQSLAADESLIREFITESTEHLCSIESQLLVLEHDGSPTETLNGIFRAFHTVKGLAGFLEFADIQSLAHEVETLLDLARTSQIVVTSSVVDIILESTDVARYELDCIAQRLDGNPAAPTRVNAALLHRIRQAAATSQSSPEPTSPAPSSTPIPTPTPIAISVPATPSTPPEQPHPPVAVAEIAPHDEPITTPSGTKERRNSDSSSVRIDTGKLDQLMDMVSEMVIAQTLIQHSPQLEGSKDPLLQRNLTQLARITADVQGIATSMRMIPIGAQFQKTARLVRDLARRAGKQITFESAGEETELDKTIAEQLSDPLLHMVRNSVDHGIEPPEERTALGKDPTARIRISAYHHSGQIVVEISDDGRGLNRQKILAKARQNGLIQEGSELTDSEVFQLIFEPGFSTAEKITDTSGRGVGMDVVRKHVQKMRGRIDIQSTAGVGTTFLIRLPLTLAIIDGLVLMVGDQRYVAPIFAIREIFRPTQNMLSTVHGTGEMVMVRGGLLPIVRLHRNFGIEPRTHKLTDGSLIVTESEGRSFCLFVDDLIGKQEVVIKSLGRRFKDVTGIAGCAILGDGRVGLILDIDGIFKGRN
jgi:two-component system chemotaxis sensor kinase CheA